MGQYHETRVIIGSADCDLLGHMNVARYIALSNQNGFAMQTAMGWIPGQERDGRRLSFAVVDMQSRFLAEILAGEVVTVRTSIRRIGTKSATFHNRILNNTGALAFQSDWISACLDLDARRAVAIPDLLRADLEVFLEAEPALQG